MKLFQVLLLFLFSILAQEASAQYATSIIVAKDGSGDYTSIQEAINNTKSFPDLPITIFIKKGVYEEKVRVYPWNTHLTLEGEDREGTIISWDDHFKKIDKGRNSTFLTSTLSLEANDCTLKNLTIRNTAGPVGQAIALTVSGDRCVVQNCHIPGHQDTLYCTGEGSRQYFSNCHIEGTTDFIFGNATAVFEKCTLKSLSDSFITAASTTADQAYGFVFRNCTLTAAEDVKKCYLGRPWRAYAKTVFISCDYGAHILPAGWDNWSSTSNEQTAYYAEYAPNQDLQNRVDWSKRLSKKDLKKYSNIKVFSGWMP
jgi:pectinesterase